jgi:surface protein
MSDMFSFADQFNRDLSSWDVRNVTNMAGMFHRACRFNGDISRWDASNIRSMSCMFQRASQFKGDLSRWDVNRVEDMSHMFEGASQSNADLSQWKLNERVRLDDLFDRSSRIKRDFFHWCYLMGLSKRNIYHPSVDDWSAREKTSRENRPSCVSFILALIVLVVFILIPGYILYLNACEARKVTSRSQV